jgi:hypothetical protein
VPHLPADDKDAIRDSILRGTYLEDFGMERVLNSCRDDKVAANLPRPARRCRRRSISSTSGNSVRVRLPRVFTRRGSRTTLWTSRWTMSDSTARTSPGRAASKMDAIFRAGE